MVRFILCGRVTLHAPEPLVRETFRLDPAGSQSSGCVLRPRYNIAPSQDVAIVRDTGAGRELVLARWGLVPYWSKTSQAKYSTSMPVLSRCRKTRVSRVVQAQTLPDTG